MSGLALIPVALTTSFVLLSAAAVARVVRGRAPARSRLPAVSVLKPLCGADPSLEQNLRSFFEQDHPDMELLFGVENEDDPAVGVVERLLERYPSRRATLVVHGARAGHNPKVRNLRGLAARAAHDLVLVSDSNVWAPPHYVSEAAALYEADATVGLVTHLFAGRGEATFAARLECVQLTGFVAQGAALPTVLGDGVVIGKSMMFSLANLERAGGLGSVADVLAEDFVVGKMIERMGLRVALAPTVLTNVVGSIDLKTLFDRHLRWSMLRIRLRPAAFWAEPLTCPLAVLPFAVASLGPALAFAWLAAMYGVRDLLGWGLVRGRDALAWPALLGPARDVLALAVWIATPAKRHVRWRGHRVRVGKRTVLYAA